MKQRARNDEDKAGRVGAILDAARQLWDESSYGEFTVGAVAERAGIVKGTVFLYFPTKERLLFAVFESYLDEYFDAVDGALAKQRRRWPAAAASEVLFTCFSEPLLRLLPIAAPVLEKNVDDRVASTLRHELDERLAFTGKLLEKRLRCNDGATLMRRALALATGLAASVLRIDLQREFVEMMTAMLTEG